MYCLYYLLVCVLLDWCTTVQGIQSRVYDAQKLRHDVHKYLVRLFIDRQLFDSYCTGSIISARHLITSAHCVNFHDLQNVLVYHHVEKESKIIGQADLNDTLTHPDYNVSDDRAYDIAVLKTKEPMVFNTYVQPIELGQFVPKLSETGIIAGYGENGDEEEWGGREGAVLITRCPVDKDWICSKDIVRAGSGDSGGALVYKKRLVGVTSGSCKDAHKTKPCITVFANVPKVLVWIRSILENDGKLLVNYELKATTLSK